MCKGTGSFIYNKLSLVKFIIRLNSTQQTKTKKVTIFNSINIIKFNFNLNLNYTATKQS